MRDANFNIGAFLDRIYVESHTGIPYLAPKKEILTKIVHHLFRREIADNQWRYSNEG